MTDATPAVRIVPRGPGHCDDDAAWSEFVRQYDGQPRSFANMTDFQLANALFMAGRDDLNLLHLQTAAKERIRWLSIELAKALAAAPVAPGGEGELSRQMEILRKAAAVPVPDDDSDFDIDKARRGAKSWRTIASNVLAEYDALRARSSPDLSGGGEREIPPYDPDAPELVQHAILCAESIERFPNWLDSHDLITARAHAVVLAQDLPTALSPREGVEPEAGAVAWRIDNLVLGGATFTTDEWFARAEAADRYDGKPVRKVTPLYTHPTPAEPEAGAVEVYHAERIAEIMDEGDGFWRPCSGCQEGVDGYASQTDYPYSRVFRCQPGGGCSECGGLGVLWDDTDYDQMAKDMLADMEAEEAHPSPADERVRVAVEALKYAVGLLPGLAGADSAPDHTVYTVMATKREILNARESLALLTANEDA